MQQHLYFSIKKRIIDKFYFNCCVNKKTSSKIHKLGNAIYYWIIMDAILSILQTIRTLSFSIGLSFNISSFCLLSKKNITTQANPKYQIPDMP